METEESGSGVSRKGSLICGPFCLLKGEDPDE